MKATKIQKKHKDLFGHMVFAFIFIFSVTAPSAEEAGGHNDRSIDRERRAAIIEAVADKLHKLYVYPDIAQKMTTHIRRRQAAGA